MAGELSPGSTTRRWLPDGGEKKLRHKIHKESKNTDKYKKLPYEFSKPLKPKKQRLFECEKCGYVIAASKNTVMVVCGGCKELSNVKELE